MLRRLSFRHFFNHKLRILSTVGGIALGVAAQWRAQCWAT
jgi:hypothetical protein